MHKRLLLPGPTEVSPEILDEQTRFLIGHRTEEFSEFYTEIIKKLNKFFQLPSNYEATVTTSSGTLWFDIVGRSIIEEKALICINGAFSQRFGKTIRACSKETDFLEVEWGKAIKPDMIAEKLDSGGYDTAVICHNETSTGVRNPIYEIGETVKKDHPNIMLVIDSVSGMAGDKVLPSRIGCDVIFASTQKCFALPPGLAIGNVNKQALERARRIPYRGTYTNLTSYFDYFEKKHQTPFTPNIPLLYALDRRMDLLLEETHEGVYQRHKAMAEFTQEWAKKHFALFAEPGFESVTVTCIENTSDRDVNKLNEKLAERRFMISNGYGKLSESTFRIGHMGEWVLSGIREVLSQIEEIWGLSE